MRFWLGAYTADAGGSATGIGVLHAGSVDSPLASGELAFAGVAAAADSPSWLAAHPSLDMLYAAQEAAGTVRAFVRTGEESFAPLGRPVEVGDRVCHVAVAPDGGSLIASCYGDGNVVRLPLDAAGRLGVPRVAAPGSDPYAPTASTERSGRSGHFEDLAAIADMAGVPLEALPVLGRPPVPDAVPRAAEPTTRVSRAHQARFLPEGIIVTTDLGLDVVRFWTATEGGLRETQRVILPRGSGPRHTVWHPSGHLFVVTEHSLEVFVLGADPSAPPSARWRVVAGGSIGAEVTPGADAAAEVALTRDGRYVIVGVRGSDTLGSLRVGDGGATVSPVAVVEAGVAWPRHHVVERDTVLVTGERSDDIAALALDERTGVPGRVRRRVEVASPTCVLADRGERGRR